MRRAILASLALLFVTTLFAATLPIALAAPGDTSPAATAIADPMQEVTPEREAAALTFAKLHHPELASLLKVLKASPHDGYEDAVRDLFKTSERLTRLKARTPERYELELQLWKVDSRIRLLAARLAMEDNEELRDQLHKLLREKIDIRAAVLRDDRTKTAARLEKFDADLQQLTADPAASADAELERLLKSAKATAQKNQRPAKANTSTTNPGKPKAPAGKAADKTEATSATPERKTSASAPSSPQQ
jgi:hypothetical protein